MAPSRARIATVRRLLVAATVVLVAYGGLGVVSDRQLSERSRVADLGDLSTYAPQTTRGAVSDPLPARLDAALDAVAGSNDRKVIVCNKVVRRKITSLLRAAAGGSAMSEIGPQAREYDGATIEVLDEDGDEAPILAFDESQGSSNVTTSLYVIRPGGDVDGEHVQGLIGADLVEHVAVGLQGTYYTDIVEANIGLGMFHPRAACRVRGITNA
jgi:hypothetical protein